MREDDAPGAEPDTPSAAPAAQAPAAQAQEAQAPAPPPDAQPSLNLSLAPSDAARLARLPDFARLRGGRPRASPTRVVWHDAADLPLFALGLALGEHRVGARSHWRLERTAHAPGDAPRTVAEADTLPALRDALAALGGPALPDPVAPVAAFEGTTRVFPLTAASGASRLRLVEGTLRAVMSEHSVCRVAVEPGGPGGFALARMLAGPLRLDAARVSLASEAMQLARPGVGALWPDARLPPGVAVGDAFARIVAGLAAELLGQAPEAAVGGATEPVHRMRVALRRLRSAISLFQKAVDTPELDLLRAELREVARVLGPARDWDVFIGGTGGAVAAAFPEDRSVSRMLAAARRRRQASYAELAAMVEGAAFRRLGLTLAQVAMLRPWEHGGGDGEDAAARRTALLSTELEAYAARALQHRQKRVASVGDDLSGLPVAELHALRIQGKRLRYAAEFFAPLFPGRPVRRYIRRLAAVQERLGHLNDASVAAALMAELGGADRFAAGIVHGFVAARGEGARAKAERSWNRFVRTEPFWKNAR